MTTNISDVSAMKLDIASILERQKRIELKLIANNKIYVLLFIGNLLGALIGFEYYLNIIGMDDIPIYLWLLVPDCPMAAFLFLGCLIQRKEIKYHAYNAFVFIQLIRSAMFTYLIIINYGSLDLAIVILGHFALIIEALMLLPFLKINKYFLIAIFITFFNDFMDFFGGTLAQIETIRPLFQFYFTSILLLDLFLVIIVFFIAIRYNNNIRLKQVKMNSYA